MSTGNMTVDVGFVLSVNDNSCASARVAVESFYSGSWKLISCSSDPVNSGSFLNLSHVLSGSLTKWTVTSMTATNSTDLISTDTAPGENINIEVLLVIAFIFLFFIGFHTGSQNGNR